jgi:hypothetical protein
MVIILVAGTVAVTLKHLYLCCCCCCCCCCFHSIYAAARGVWSRPAATPLTSSRRLPHPPPPSQLSPLLALSLLPLLLPLLLLQVYLAVRPCSHPMSSPHLTITTHPNFSHRCCCCCCCGSTFHAAKGVPGRAPLLPPYELATPKTTAPATGCFAPTLRYWRL